MRLVRSHALLIALAISACGHGAHAGEAPNDEDRAFVAAMVPHHALGIRLIEDAVPRVDDVRLRRLVFKMSAYHDAELHLMEHHLDEWGVEPMARFPGWIDPGEMAALTSLKGSAYDIRWIRLMVDHHNGAIEMADDFIARVDDSSFARIAADISDTQRNEISMMMEILSELCSELSNFDDCRQK